MVVNHGGTAAQRNTVRFCHEGTKEHEEVCSLWFVVCSFLDSFWFIVYSFWFVRLEIPYGF
jgi:hypothetical protein